MSSHEEEIIKLKKEIEFLQIDVSLKAEELKFFIESGKALTSSLSVNEVLHIIMAKTKEVVNCDMWLLFLVDEKTNKIYVELAEGANAVQLKRPRLKKGEGFAGWVVKHRKSLLVENTKDDPRAKHEFSLIGQCDIISLACMPIITNENVIGVLEMASTSPDKNITQQNLNILEQLADHSAIAIEKARLYQKMEELSITDDLTKLFNIRYMDKNLDYEIRRCQRYSTSVGSIFLDLDFFKTVNDTHGHRVGSKVLQETALILQRNLRDVDIIARFGGDEFVIILPETDIKTTVKIAERLRESIAKNLFLEEENLNIKLTASFGVSEFPLISKDKADLIDSADKAMYESKNNGKNKVSLAKKSY